MIMGGDDKQLLFGTGAALLVLALGLVAYFSTSSSTPPPAKPPPEARARASVTKAARPDAVIPVPPRVDDATPVPEQPEAPAEQDEADEGSSLRSRLPKLHSGTQEPRVRPEHLTASIEEDLRASEAEFQACYATELERRPSAKGRALLQFSIDENSEVSSINVELRAIPSMDLKLCLQGVAEQVVFGSVDEPAIVYWPLLMWPDKGLSVQSPVGR
jgi:hypothetical protein